MTSLVQLSRVYPRLLAVRKTAVVASRQLNLLEYQSKKLLEQSGVAIQAFRVLEGRKDEDVLKDFSELIVDSLLCCRQ